MATIDDFLSWVESDFYQAGLHVELVERDESRPFSNTVTIRLHTDNNTYQIHAVEKQGGGYLGCGATSRKARAGEDWLRGNDRHDGPLTRETWIGILTSIVSYELVRVHRNALGGKDAWSERKTPDAIDEMPTAEVSQQA